MKKGMTSSFALLASMIVLISTSRVSPAQEQVAAPVDSSSLWQEFFPLHLGDTWVYGYFCTYFIYEGKRVDPFTTQEATLTRVITHIDTIGGQAYYMTQDTYPSEFAGIVHSNYRMDRHGQVYAYEPQLGVELLVFRLNAQPSVISCSIPEYCHRWLEYEGELPERYRYLVGSWIKEDMEAYAGYYDPLDDYMFFSKFDRGMGYMDFGHAVLCRGIGIISAAGGGDLWDVECGFRLLSAVIDGQEYTFRPWWETAVQKATWGDLKGSFSKP